MKPFLRWLALVTLSVHWFGVDVEPEVDAA
jgi:hypothetical protein